MQKFIIAVHQTISIHFWGKNSSGHFGTFLLLKKLTRLAAGKWWKSLLAVQWAEQDSQHFCPRINFARDQRDSIGEVVARWNDFNSRQNFILPRLDSFPWLRLQPHIPARRVQKMSLAVLTKVSWSPVLSSLGRAKKEFAAFSGKRSLGCFSLHISYGTTTHRTRCLFSTWIYRKVHNLQFLGSLSC